MELLQKARSLYESGEMHDALEVAQAACEHKPKDAEAWWLLGCISRYTNLPAASDDAFRRASQLSRKRPAPVRVDTAHFRAIVDRAVAQLSTDARRRLELAEIRVDKLPPIEAVKAGASPDAPATRQRQPEDVLTLFQVNLENRSGSEAELARLVGRTLARA
jgi:hypothetical protein